MAAEAAPMPINGYNAPIKAQNYAAAEPSYQTTEQNIAAHNANSANTINYAAAAPSASAASNASASNTEISKEEVGWYFVERYYTTLSKNPDKLFLFYNKKSQSVFGVEEEKSPVCVGQKAINERMKELDFKDCKVRVTNVDSQASGQDIVIQVIGEISNNSQPHKKFVQTFVLATQTNGYFVLNDIFRYIAEEEDPVEQEEVTGSSTTMPVQSGYQEPVPTTEETEPKTLTSSTEVVETEHDAQLVDEELEKVIQEEEKEPTLPAQVNGTPVPEGADVAEAEEAPAAAVAVPEPDAVQETVPPEADLQPEKPQDPSPSPVVTPAPQPAPSAPKAPAAAPSKPVAKTWASLVSSNKSATPAAPAPSAPAPAPAQQKSTPPAQTQSNAPPSAPAATTAPPREASPADGQQGDGWQAVGGDHNRNKSRTQGQAGNETPRIRAYIKNVYPSVDGNALKSQLSKYGELAYFDVSRQKNCAFVDFATQAGFQAAVNANPHQVGSDQIYVEERRERPYGQFQPRGGMRGGRGGGQDNRAGGQGQGRGGFQGNKENARPGGGFPGGRGGRGNVTPRGRGSSQAV